jgi:hypothetical protein
MSSNRVFQHARDVAVEKLLPHEIRQNEIASGYPTNDDLNFLDIFYPGNSDRLGGNWTFSTPTLFTTVAPEAQKPRLPIPVQ